MALRTHGRYRYSAITQRPHYRWEGDRQLAVYIALNLEHFEFGRGLGASLAPGGPQPDVLNFAWRDYGNRVGVWRLLELFDQLQLPVALLVNSEIYHYCPEVVTAFRERQDEIVAHGRTNSERQNEGSEADESRLIAKTTAVIRDHEGRAPQGWLCPWIAQSELTPDLLQEAGYGYLLDWCSDDQPIWFKTRQGRILSVPYPQEVNDIPAIVARRMGAAEFAEMIVDNFEEMRLQAEQQPLVYGIALHPYVVGQPFRLRHLRRALTHIAERAAADQGVWLTYPGAIAKYVSTLPAGVVP